MSEKYYTSLIVTFLSLGLLLFIGRSQNWQEKLFHTPLPLNSNSKISKQNFYSQTEDTTKYLLIDLKKFKSRLDSFVITEKNSKKPLELKTDTINANSTFKELWAFNKGLFEIIEQDSTELLVRHHFYEPDTRRLLRLYLLEIYFESVDDGVAFFKNKLETRKKYTVDLTEEIYMEHGLTGTTDYVIHSGNSILWLNASCQYSRIEFDQLINIFKGNLESLTETNFIKCYCQELCE